MIEGIWFFALSHLIIVLFYVIYSKVMLDKPEYLTVGFLAYWQAIFTFIAFLVQDSRTVQLYTAEYFYLVITSIIGIVVGHWYLEHAEEEV